MSERYFFIKESTLKSIAEAVRERGRTTDKIPVEEIENAIRAIRPLLQTKHVFSNGPVVFDEGFEGLQEVIVDVAAADGRVIEDYDGAYTLEEVSTENGEVLLNLQAKEVEGSTKEDIIVTADDTYDALSAVTVKKTPRNLQIKDFIPATIYETVPIYDSILPEEGYDGLSEVRVKRINKQMRAVYPSESIQILDAQTNLGYDVLGQLTVYAIPIDNTYDGSSNSDGTIKQITTNGEFTPTKTSSGGNRYYKKVKVNVTPKLEIKTGVSASKKQNVEVVPSNGYDGLKKVVIDKVTLNLQSLTTTPEKRTKIISAASSYDGLKQVTINPIPDNYIDPDGEHEKIIANGEYDVRQFNKVVVEIAETNVSVKSITVCSFVGDTAQIYKASDEQVNGYNEVTVEPIVLPIYDKEAYILK